MEWLSLDGVPWWSLLLAVVVTFALGWVWYSPVGFFPMWARLGKLTPEDMKSSNMVVAFGGTLAGNILGVLLLGVLISSLGVSGIWQGALLGGLIGLAFRGGALLVLLYFGTVWLNWGGHQAVWWNLPERKFFIFGAPSGHRISSCSRGC